MDPFEPLKYQEPLATLKATIENEGSKAVLASLIEKYILNNTHLVIIEMQVLLILGLGFYSFSIIRHDIRVYYGVTWEARW